MTTEPDQQPVNGLNDVVHQRVRLGIRTVARQARRVEFGFLRAALGLTAGNLSQHLAVLEKAGLIHIEKGYEGKRARTWLSPNPGRRPRTPGRSHPTQATRRSDRTRWLRPKVLVRTPGEPRPP